MMGQLWGRTGQLGLLPPSFGDDRVALFLEEVSVLSLVVVLLVFVSLVFRVLLVVLSVVVVIVTVILLVLLLLLLLLLLLVLQRERFTRVRPSPVNRVV